MKFLDKFEPHTYAAMRIVTGFLFLFHGSKKLFGWPSAMGFEMPWHIHWVAGPIEFFGGLAVMLGLFTRPMAFLCSGMAAAAYFVGHASRAFWPIENGGELAALYAFVFLAIAAKGSGIWAVDGMMGKKAG